MAVTMPEADAPDPVMRWPFGAVIVLASSAIVLVAEIVAARVIAPYVGVTLETFSAVIGCVLAGIAIGNGVGGWLADRVPARVLLTASLALGGVALIASPRIVRALGPDMEPSSAPSALWLAVSAFLLPSIALSTITPTVVKSIGQGSRRLGSIAGTISALGTAGALIGNFGAGFVLVGELRSGQILVACGVACLLLAALTMAVVRDRKALPVATRSAAVVVLVGAAAVGSQLSAQIPCFRETKYTCLNIYEIEPDTYLIRANLESTSVTNPVDPTDLYFDYIRDAAAVAGQVLGAGRTDAAFGYVGGGGYTLPLYFEATYPGSTHLVYEIDGELVDGVAAGLGIPDLEQRFPTVVGDARATIRSSPEPAFDVIIGDAFSGIAVPWHLTTEEFLEDVEARLRPGGVYIMNLIDYDHYDMARAEARTFREVFANVVLVAPELVFAASDPVGSNILLIGGEALPDAATLGGTLAAGGSDFTVVDGEAVTAFIGDETVLTDDYAPVDQLLGRP